ncbi:MAG: hypothetical protein WC833_06600 [Bacteroidales bacterium]
MASKPLLMNLEQSLVPVYGKEKAALLSVSQTILLMIHYLL